MAPDLSTVRFARYGANFIPRNAPVLADVDDINTNVGFWAPQPDFRIPERLSPGFTDFPDLELEAIYEDQVKTFVALPDPRRAAGDHAESRRRPGDDLHRAAGRLGPPVHADRPRGRRPTSRDPNTIGSNQDRGQGRPLRPLRQVRLPAGRPGGRSDHATRRARTANVFVVSDHGMAPFHTAVSLTNLLRNAGVDTSQLAIRTSGAGGQHLRQPGRPRARRHGRSRRPTQRSVNADRRGAAERAGPQLRCSTTRCRGKRIFTTVATRPDRLRRRARASAPASRSARISATSSRMLDEGYNFDGIQNPGVARSGRPGLRRRHDGVLGAELLRRARPRSATCRR